MPILSKYSKKIEGIHEGLQKGFKNWKDLIWAIALSFLFHCFTVLNTLVAAYIMNWTNAPVIDLFICLPVILIIAALPLTPNGLGIQEGAFFIILQKLGADAEQALGIALLLRAKTYVLGALGGVFYANFNKIK